MQINSTSSMASVIQNSQGRTQHTSNATVSSVNTQTEESKVSEPVTLPNDGEKLETYLEIKKTQMHYQVASDMMNIASGNNNGISAPTAAYLANNEDAREIALQNKTMQQQYQSIQTYQDQTEKYQNSWVV